MTKAASLVQWAARIVAAVILLQTLYFKFSASEESVEIFTAVGMEPWGRIGIGVLELVAAVLMLISRTAWMGAVLAVGLMAGAVFFHMTVLGVVVRDDGGYLFGLALAVLACGLLVAWQHRHRMLVLIRKRG